MHTSYSGNVFFCIRDGKKKHQIAIFFLVRSFPNYLLFYDAKRFVSNCKFYTRQVLALCTGTVY